MIEFLTTLPAGKISAWELATLLVGGFFFVPFIIGLVLSAAQSFISRYLTPKVQRGKLTGQLLVQNSEEGLPIHTVYGGGLGARATGLTWTNLTRVVIQPNGSIKKISGVDNCFENASGSGDAGARSIVTITGGNWEVQFSFDSVTEGRGFAGLTTNSSYTTDYTQMRYAVHVSDQNNTSGTPHPPHSWFIYENGGPNVAFGDAEYASGKVWKIICISNVVKYYLEGRLVHTSSVAPTYPLYVAVSIACLNKTVDNLVLVRDTIDSRGGMKIAGNIIWAEKPHVVKGKAKGGKGGPRVEQLTYYTSLAVMPGFGRWRIKKLYADGRLLLNLDALAGTPTGALGTLDSDAFGNYDIYIPPDASGGFGSLIQNTIRKLYDPNDTVVSPLLNGAALRLYSGSYDQLPDSLIQANVGAANTPAYRGRALAVIQNFNISKYSDDRAGYYIAVAPMTADDWEKATVYEDRGAGYNELDTFENAATIGKAVSALPDGDPAVWDFVTTIDVDLYAAGALENATETQVLNGANAAVLGNEFIQFVTAEKLGGFTNRWRLKDGLLRGRRGSDYATGTHQSGERFVLLDSNVQFIENALSLRGCLATLKRSRQA